MLTRRFLVADIVDRWQGSILGSGVPVSKARDVAILLVIIRPKVLIIVVRGLRRFIITPLMMLAAHHHYANDHHFSLSSLLWRPAWRRPGTWWGWQWLMTCYPFLSAQLSCWWWCARTHTVAAPHHASHLCEDPCHFHPSLFPPSSHPGVTTTYASNLRP